MEEIKHSVELNKVSAQAANLRIPGSGGISLTFFSSCSGQCTEGNRGERASLLRAGAIHPEDSGRTGGVYRREAEADGELGRRLYCRAGTGNSRPHEEEKGPGEHGSHRPHSLLKSGNSQRSLLCFCLKCSKIAA